MKNKEINDLINKSMLDLIYKERKETLYQHNKYDDNKIKEITIQNPITYKDLITAIKNLPPHFNNTREYILERLEGYLTRENSIVAFDNEKFYKVGFCDGAKMILEILKQEK